MSRTDAARGIIQTVLGPIAPGALGPTLMHEHVLCDVTPPDLAVQNLPDVEITIENCWEIRHHWCRHMGNSRLDEEQVAIRELEHLVQSGGSGLVELTCDGIRPNPRGLQRVSKAAGLHVVMGCGWYVESFLQPGLEHRSVDDLTRETVRAVTDGVGDTGIPAGIIGEIGCSTPWTRIERKVMQAAVVAQRETGAALNIHPPRTADELHAVIDFIRTQGGDLARTIVSHVDRTLFTDDELARLADAGCVVEFDFFGIESSYYPFRDEVDLPNDGMRLKMIRHLIERGHLGRIVLSQDICTKTRLRRYGGHGYHHLLLNVVPMMRRRGFTEREIGTLLVDTPRRLLTLQ